MREVEKGHFGPYSINWDSLGRRPCHIGSSKQYFISLFRQYWWANKRHVFWSMEAKRKKSAGSKPMERGRFPAAAKHFHTVLGSLTSIQYWQLWNMRELYLAVWLCSLHFDGLGQAPSCRAKGSFNLPGIKPSSHNIF